MKEIIEGLTILLKYAPDGECHAEHDILYAAPEVEHVSPEDAERLKQLHWSWDSANRSWRIFV